MTTGFDDEYEGGYESGFIDEPGDAPSGGGNNRLFVILAVGLLGLLVLGLMGVGAVVILNRTLREQQLAAATATPTVPVVLQPSPTLTFTPVRPTPTNTPLPTATNTPVVGPTTEGEPGEPGAATPTKTPVPVGTPVREGEVPDTGLGGFGAFILGTGLAGILFVVRRLRNSL